MFLDLEDAIQVLKINGFLDSGYADDDGLEIVRNELEQKCYIKSENDTVKNISSLTCDINPKEIASQIEHDNLGQWCEILRAELNACVAKDEVWDED